MIFHIQLINEFKRLVDDPLIFIFVWSVIADVATGIVKSMVTKNNKDKSNSTKGLNGLIKHIVVLFLVVSIYPYMQIAGFDAPANTLVVFYVLIYIISILENLGQMGVPIPPTIKKHLLKLQDDYNKKEI